MIESISDFYKSIQIRQNIIQLQGLLQGWSCECLKSIQDIFKKMQIELDSGYSQKLDIMRCYLHLLIHETMKMQQTSRYVPHKNAAQRIIELFLTLLDRQFPVEIPQRNLVLKTATDYANRLSVHVNHLNRVVKCIQRQIV